MLHQQVRTKKREVFLRINHNLFLAKNELWTSLIATNIWSMIGDYIHIGLNQTCSKWLPLCVIGEKIHIQKQNKKSDSLLLPANTESPGDLTVSDRQQRREAIQHAPSSGLTSQAVLSPRSCKAVQLRDFIPVTAAVSPTGHWHQKS